VSAWMSWLRSRLTYANVMATVAVFVALGGSSYAALHITGGQIANNTVRSKDLRNNDVRGKDVRRGTLTGADVKDESLAGKDLRESTLARVPLASAADTAGDAALLGGLPADAFERSDQVKRVGPVDDSTPGTEAGPEVSYGPFRFGLFCQYAGAEDVVGVASTEDHALLTYIVPTDDVPGTVQHFVFPDLGNTSLQMASSSKPTPYAKTIDGWALAPSGFRMHFSIWFGQGIPGADSSTCSFGGEFRRG